MIIDLQRFVAAEQPHWTQLERLLDRLTRTSSNEEFLASLKTDL